MNNGWLHRLGAVLMIGAVSTAGLTGTSTAQALGAGPGANASPGSVAGADTSADTSAYTGAGPGTGVGVSAGTKTPGALAPMSGFSVDGAVYGSTAVARAGSAAEDFRWTHQRILDTPVNSGPPSPPTPGQLHSWWGDFPNEDSGAGLMATQSVNPDFRLSNASDVLYAPTMKPADGSCVEVVTVYTAQVPQLWAWDWCKSKAPGAEVNIDSTFMAKYATTVNGRTAYTVKDVQTDKSSNTWTAYLYNYQTSAWDAMFRSAGTDQSGQAQGWNMFEFYSSANPSTGSTFVCGDIAKAGLVVESSSAQIETGNNVWTPADAKNSSWMPSAQPDPAAYECPNLVFTIVKGDSDWTVSEN